MKNLCLSECTGFTLLELLVVVSLMGIACLVAFPSIGVVSEQMRAAGDIRGLASDLSDLRAEAIRLRTNVRVTLINGGYRWDIDDDGTSDGSRYFSTNSAWSGSMPSSILFNGLGLTRGISSTQALSVKNGHTTLSLTINHNSHIKL